MARGRKKTQRQGLTQTEAAQLLGITQKAVSARIQRGTLHTCPDGSVDPTTIIATVKARTSANDSDAHRPRDYWDDKRAEAEAKLKWLAYHKAAGVLIERDKVEEHHFAGVRMIRDRILTVPDRVGPLLASATDARRCRDIVRRELRQALEGMAAEMAQVAEEADAD